MKEKLIRTEKQYVLQDEHGIVIATSYEDGKLSLKNCQVIERGYDLDELAFYEFPNNNFNGQTSIEQKIRQSAFKVGFQKALEILGDKKFSDIDVKRAMRMIFDWSEGEDDHSECTSLNELWDKYFESTQQTEWEVEIEMESINIGAVSSCFHPKDFETKIPKLDADGCLILKRVI